jgi:RND family efflux transporter MFP subunit
MKLRFEQRFVPPLFFVALILGTCGLTWWVLLTGPAGGGKAPAPIPAKIAKPVKEEQLNTITLSPEAIENLNLQVGVVERKSVPRNRVYGGEAMAPIGKSVVVSAPVSGTLRSKATSPPSPGDSVKKGTVLFELLPLVTPEGRASLAASKSDAEGAVKSAEKQLEAATIALDRAKKLLAGEAGSQRAVDEAQAQHDLAKEALNAAKSRLHVIEAAAKGIESGTAAPIALTVPQDGMLHSVSAVAGQTVPSGAPLFDVVNLDDVWVRVAIYVGDLSTIDAAADAGIGNLTGRPGTYTLKAKKVAAPPSANATAGTVDLYYGLANNDGFRPGQRVGVSVPLVSSVETLTVPWSSIVHDIYGGTWVYEATGEREFTRRRVVVRHVVSDTAVLAAGPEAGKHVVTAGAAELFGTETGFSK